MPQFKLQGKDRPEYAALDEFTRAYIEAAFFTGAANDADDTRFNDGEYGIADLAPPALQKMIDDCMAFQVFGAYMLVEAYEHEGYTKEQAGHDFWLTRNHHGAGFWDRELGKIGDRLTKAAHKFSEAYLYVGDDGLVYV